MCFTVGPQLLKSLAFMGFTAPGSDPELSEIVPNWHLDPVFRHSSHGDCTLCSATIESCNLKRLPSEARSNWLSDLGKDVKAQPVRWLWGQHVLTRRHDASLLRWSRHC